jgi:glutamate synthase domain-containing protein 3
MEETMETFDATALDLKTANGYIKASANGQAVRLDHAVHLHGLAAGLTHGEIIIEGDAGDYLGVLNAGATIRVAGNAGLYLADNMTAGTVIVAGNAGYGAGQYCYGGTVVVRGSAGDFTATMNKGAAILIGGDVGDEAATYMLKGDLVVVGNAGRNFANYLIRGNVFIAGKWESLGHNTRVEPPGAEDLARLAEYFAAYEIQAEPAAFKKIIAASEKPFYH